MYSTCIANLTYFIRSDQPSKSNSCIVLVSVVLPIIQQDELMKWHLSGIKGTRIRVIGVK